MFRIGYGYDVHPFAPNRQLWLGGVHIPHHLGLLGHSDADVLLHAICDALLGSLALGDIGKHFPNTDERYRGIASIELLRHSYQLVLDRGYVLGNMDATVVAEAPKVNPHVAAMQAAISAAMPGTASDQISIKATTNEQLGFVGREEGIAAMAVALVVKA